jgi:S-layer family protein
MQGRSISLTALLILVAAAFLSGGCKCRLLPVGLEVDPSLTGNSDADGMLEPFETVDVEPSWQQKVTGPCSFVSGKIHCTGSGDFTCKTNLTETGSPVSLTGPSGGDYAVQNTPTTYGPMSYNGTKSGAYAINVSAVSGRPAPHWDATFTESLAGTWPASKSWTLHIGDSFWDVPRSHPFYKKVETLLHTGVTTGCAPGAFCPNALLSRSDIAVFTARVLAKGGANIPASGTVGSAPYDCAAGGTSLFRDVSPTDAFCKHFHYLAAKNVMPGCQPFFDCPGRLMTRLEMAQTVARAMVAPSGDAAVPSNYGPDPVTGLSYSCDPESAATHFSDVDASHQSCRHVHYLWAKGVIAGCGPDMFCPDGDIARSEMAKFLVNAFQLKLYGP